MTFHAVAIAQTYPLTESLMMRAVVEKQRAWQPILAPFVNIAFDIVPAHHLFACGQRPRWPLHTLS